MMTQGLLVLLCMFTSALQADMTPASTLDGTWKFVAEKSTDLATWRYRVLQLEIATTDSQVRIVHQWMEGGAVAFADSFLFRPGGGKTSMDVHSEIWPDNWYMGVLAIKGSTKGVSGFWFEQGTILRVVTDQPVQTSQGRSVLTTSRVFRLNPDSSTLTLTEQRSSRPTPAVLIFERLQARKP